MNLVRLFLPVFLFLSGGAAGYYWAPTPEYRLQLYHTHTHRTLDIVYRKGDQYVPKALNTLDAFLGDYREGRARHFDPRLFDLLWDLEVSLGRPGARIDVVSAYRTPKTNRRLRKLGRAAARHSLHMKAEAMDIRLPGVSTSRLRDAALRLKRGGVGYYRSSRFVHVDVGPVRRW